MSSERTPPFQPGKTFCAGQASAEDAAILGTEVEVRDTIRGWSRIRRLRAVKNETGAAVLPSRLVQLSADGRSITGYGLATAPRSVPVDEQLPASGCANGDICYVVVKGPALVLSPLSNMAADIAAGDFVNCITAVTSGATTAGRFKARPIVAATADATAGQRNVTENDGVFGRAISSCLTNSTNSLVLIDVNPW